MIIAERPLRIRVKRLAPIAASYAALLLVALVMLVPLILISALSVTPEKEIFAWPPRLIPSIIRLANFAAARVSLNLDRTMLNSCIVSIGSTACTVVFASMAGYAFAKLPFRGSRAIFIILLATMMIPAEVLIVPVYLLLLHVPLAGDNGLTGSGGTGLLNTYPGIILPGTVGVVFIFLFRQYFLSLPRDLGDQARVDGCPEFGVFWRIYLPLARPVIATVAVIAFIDSWNDLIWPLIISNDPSMYTVQVSLYSYKSVIGYSDKLWSSLMAANLISCVPPVVLFSLFQQHIVRGIAFTGVRG